MSSKEMVRKPRKTEKDVLRDQAENKREISRRYSPPWMIAAYYMVREKVCTIFVEDESNGTAVEWAVPRDPERPEDYGRTVQSHFDHALGNPNARFPEVPMVNE